MALLVSDLPCRALVTPYMAQKAEPGTKQHYENNLGSGACACTQPAAYFSAAASPGIWKVVINVCQCTGGAELYEAAVLLKSVLRGRGILLIEDRTDIVGAAEADGVVLSRQGVVLIDCASHHLWVLF